MRTSHIVGCLLLLFGCLFSLADAQTLRTVALTGDPAPGTSSGVNFSDFVGYVFINDAGQTAFLGKVSDGSNDLGIWSEGSGSLGLVAREGNPAPGTDKDFRPFFGYPMFNNAGQMAFFAHFTGGYQGVWSEGSGTLSPVAVTLDEAPGTDDQFITFEEYSLVFNDAGQTAFMASLYNRSGTGIWSEGGGSLALVALPGEAAPGTDELFGAFGQFRTNPVLNNAGQVAFVSGLYKPGSGEMPGSGVWAERDGSLTLIAHSGDAAPGTSANFLTFQNGPAVINNAGQTAFSAFLTGPGVNDDNQYGIWSEGSGSLALEARSGEPAPGTGVIYNYLSSKKTIINDVGQVAFTGGILNNAGQVAYSTRSKIWAQDTSGVFQHIAQVGEVLDVDDGPGTDLRTISGLTFTDMRGDETTSGAGKSYGFNNLGQLAFLARFTDGTQGIFVSSLVAIPEPSTLLLGSLIGLGVLMRRQR